MILLLFFSTPHLKNNKYKYSLKLYLKITFFLIFLGEDCSQVADLGYWEVVEPKNSFLPRGSASHSAVVWKDSLYIIGGESYHAAEMMYTYDFTGKYRV